MTNVDVISAAEAKRASLDKRREAKILTTEAVDFILGCVDMKVRHAIQFSEFQVSIPLAAINRLNDINIEAAKNSVVLLGNYLRELGYHFDSFTNYKVEVTISWATA